MHGTRTHSPHVWTMRARGRGRGRFHRRSQLLGYRSVNLRITSPATIPRTPPSFLRNAVILPSFTIRTTLRGIKPRAKDSANVNNVCTSRGLSNSGRRWSHVIPERPPAAPRLADLTFRPESVSSRFNMESPLGRSGTGSLGRSCLLRNPSLDPPGPPPSARPTSAGRQKNRSIFPSPTPIFALFFFSLSGCLLVEFWWCVKRQCPQMCTFGVLTLSCETLRAPTLRAPTLRAHPLGPHPLNGNCAPTNSGTIHKPKYEKSVDFSETATRSSTSACEM